MDTSAAAYDSVKPHLNAIQKEVLHMFACHPDGLTDEQLTDLCGYENRSTYRTRRNELVKKGLLVDTGLTDTMRSGRKARVWKRA